METPEEQAARLAERKRVDAFYAKGKASGRTVAAKLTPEEIAAQQAAVRRQQMMNQVAPAPVNYGLEALLNALMGQRQQQQQPQWRQ